MKASKEMQVYIDECDASAARRRHDKGKANVGEDTKYKERATPTHYLTESSNSKRPDRSD